MKKWRKGNSLQKNKLKEMMNMTIGQNGDLCAD